MEVPEQSLRGSSYMAEAGLNYQPSADSPWSFDLNMRGYAGERQGASFNVQATYTSNFIKQTYKQKQPAAHYNASGCFL